MIQLVSAVAIVKSLFIQENSIFSAAEAR